MNIKWRQIINEYKNRYITRQVIVSQYNISMNHINKMLRYHKIKIWDDVRINTITREMGRRIKNELEYKSVEELAKEYNVSIAKMRAYVKRFKKDSKPQKEIKHKDNSKYYNPLKDKDRYARMILGYNK